MDHSMVELLTPETRVRDLTSAPRQIPIEVDGSVAYETLLTMWVTFNPKEEATNFDLGPAWKKKIIEATPADLQDEIKNLGGPYCYTWLAISGLVSAAPHPHDPDSTYGWLARIDPRRLKRWIIGYVSDSNDVSLIEQAAGGDLSVLPMLIEGGKGTEFIEDAKGTEFMEHLEVLFEIPDEELAPRFAGAVQRFRKEVFAEQEVEFGAAIGRAAAARKAVATRDSAKAVIEDVTNGLDYDIPLGVTRVVLVPSVVVKPLSLIDQHRETLLVFYAVADEFVHSDPEAPPSWLVRTYKALSDERRLRILRRLSEGETSLDEITEMLGLSKSTVHHHISILRAAGLVRVHLSHTEAGAKCSTYDLREHSLADATAFLDSYIQTPLQEARHA